MFFEVAGFLAGVSGIAIAFGVLYLRDSSRVLGSFYGNRRARPASGNALIWPSR